LEVIDLTYSSPNPQVDVDSRSCSPQFDSSSVIDYGSGDERGLLTDILDASRLAPQEGLISEQSARRNTIDMANLLTCHQTSS